MIVAIAKRKSSRRIRARTIKQQEGSFGNCGGIAVVEQQAGQLGAPVLVYEIEANIISRRSLFRPPRHDCHQPSWSIGERHDAARYLMSKSRC